jgi:hypothetical protein
MSVALQSVCDKGGGMASKENRFPMSRAVLRQIAGNPFAASVDCHSKVEMGVERNFKPV